MGVDLLVGPHAGSELARKICRKLGRNRRVHTRDPAKVVVLRIERPRVPEEEGTGVRAEQRREPRPSRAAVGPVERLSRHDGAVRTADSDVFEGALAHRHTGSEAFVGEAAGQHRKHVVGRLNRVDAAPRRASSSAARPVPAPISRTLRCQPAPRSVVCHRRARQGVGAAGSISVGRGLPEANERARSMVTARSYLRAPPQMIGGRASNVSASPYRTDMAQTRFADGLPGTHPGRDRSCPPPRRAHPRSAPSIARLEADITARSRRASWRRWPMRRRATTRAPTGPSMRAGRWTAEVAAVMRVHPSTARAQMDEAERITEDFPETLEALRAGRCRRPPMPASWGRRGHGPRPERPRIIGRMRAAVR